MMLYEALEKELRDKIARAEGNYAEGVEYGRAIALENKKFISDLITRMLGFG